MLLRHLKTNDKCIHVNSYSLVHANQFYAKEATTYT